MSGQANRQFFKTVTIMPSMIWLGLLFIIPVGLVLTFSFFRIGADGNMVRTFTLDNLAAAFSQDYYRAIARTFYMAFSNAFLCLVSAFPLAWFISRQKNKKLKNVLLLLTLLPFWTNFLIRTYAWMTLLGNTGVINKALLSANLISHPIEMLFTPFAVQLGLLYNYLPFMVLPIYASIEKINEQCYLAAADLGAGNGQIFRHITLPLSVRGMLTGVFFVFIPTLGEYVIPDLLGGGKTDFIGNIIIRQFRGANNWPLGASMVLLMVMCILAGLLLKNIVFRKERSR